jgi:hypothetical protein
MGLTAMVRRFVSAVLVAASLAVAGCNASTTAAPEVEVTAPEEAALVAPFVAGEGEPQTSNPLAEDDPALELLGVVKFDDIPNISNIGSVRLIGAGGSDPATNGLKVYLAFVSPHDEAAFLLGDFLDYRVIAASPGRIDLEYDENYMDRADQIQTRTLRTIVTWTEVAQESSPNPEFPTSVTMTPAQ